MPKQKKPTYEGVLAQPMKPSLGPIQLSERMEALVKYYGAEDTNGFVDAKWYEVARGLAFDHVPGFSIEVDDEFQISDKATRDLILLVEIFKRTEEGMSVASAAALFAKKFPHLGLNAESARVRYTEMKGKSGHRKRPLGEVAKLLALLERSKGSK